MSSRPKNEFAGKKVLVFGLGLLGGGVATTNWLIKHGAQVTVTDLKTKKQLASSLKKIKGHIKLKLGGHNQEDVKNNEIIVFNPDVPPTNPYVVLARQLGKQVENEATIFYRLCTKPIIAITGTRGKTTTVNWTDFLLKVKFKSIIAGNSLDQPFLETLNKLGRYQIVVNELPSYHLEYFDPTITAPKIAVITNIFQDHLNRHGTMEDYTSAKAKIFENQSAEQDLILNYDNDWTPWLLKLKPRSRMWFFSLMALPAGSQGVFYRDNKIFFQDVGRAKAVLNVADFVAKWGVHNLQNLLASSLAAHLAGISFAQMQKRIKKLPQIPFRQETIYENKHLRIINDTSATSPDGGIAAINRFAGVGLILIAGGTDRELDYSDWCKLIRQKFKPENVILLAGSATDKILKNFGSSFPVSVFDSLAECVKEALSRASGYPKSVILFSPAAKSFEKFKNEFDRGRQFSKIVSSKY
jgi:UDP-N-acetylmuramoylalanine--D-glutamate ligase